MPSTLSPRQMNSDPLQNEIELSVVMPCLNESDTLETCIRKSQETLSREGITGEVIVADNGSTDGSIEIAERLGARIIHIERRGYGNALIGGINAAKGKYIIMGDADDSYNFQEIPKFLTELRKGAPLVQGCRLPSGGGKVLPKAMPFLHRWLGNPGLTFLARQMFGLGIHDIYCGMRGFAKQTVQKLNLQCTGMEFATEMIIKTAISGQKIAEVPITLHPDGRKAHPPHLNTFRDGWRTLRFFLLFCPKWLFFYPGIALTLFGSAYFFIALLGVRISGIHFDLHSMLIGSLAIVLGHQTITFSIISRAFSVREKLIPEDLLLKRLFQVMTLEKGILLGLASFLFGISIILHVAYSWYSSHFGDLPYAEHSRSVISGVLLATLGAQTILSSFFISALGLEKR